VVSVSSRVLWGTRLLFYLPAPCYGADTPRLYLNALTTLRSFHLPERRDTSSFFIARIRFRHHHIRVEVAIDVHHCFSSSWYHASNAVLSYLIHLVSLPMVFSGSRSHLDTVVGHSSNGCRALSQDPLVPTHAPFLHVIGCSDVTPPL
jgi:hypothetical protein